MAMPLDIPWVAGVWADQPGFVPPADGAVLPASPTDFEGNVVTRDSVLWSTSFGTSGKPAFHFPIDVSRLSITPTYVGTTVFTAVIVGQITNVAGADLLDGATGSRHLIDSNGTTWRTFAGGAVVSGGTADLNQHLFILQSNTAAVDTLTVDTVQVFSGESGSDSSGQVHIGSSVNGGHFGAKIAFAGILDRALTTQERDDLWAWYQSEYVTFMTSKRDDLLASLPPIPFTGGGSVSDRLYAQQEAAYVGADPTEPLTLNDYLVANGVDKNIIQ